MPVYTYPLAVEVPPDAEFYTGGPSPTPLFWPSAAHLASALEVEVSLVEEFERDGRLWFVVTNGAGDLIPGVWSNAAGEIVSYGSAEALAVDKFGAWRTEYLSIATADADSAEIADTAGLDQASLTISVRCRKDWNIEPDASQERTLVYRTGTTGPVFTIAHLNPTASAGDDYFLVAGFKADGNVYTATFSRTALGFVDNTWGTLTVSIGASGITASGPGGSSGALTTGGTPGDLRSSDGPVLVMSAGASNTGFGGDISDVNIGGVADLALDAMADAADTSWVNSYGTTVTRTSSSEPPATGDTTGATIRPRFDFTTPTRGDEWRLIVTVPDPGDNPGAVSIDEIAIDAKRPGGHNLGLVRGRRG